MATVLHMPAVAAGATELILSQWPLAESTEFAKADTIAVVETEKAQVEIEAEADGTILKTLVAAGSTVEVGAPIAVLGAPGEKAGNVEALLGELGIAGRDPEERPASGHPENTAGTGRARIFASPLARKMAKDAGLELEALNGTGPDGRIIRRDVEAAIAARPAPPVPTEQHAGRPVPVSQPEDAPPAQNFEEIPHSRMRRAIAARLVESKQTAPHFYLRATCRAEPLLDLRRRINEQLPAPVSVNDLIVKAAAGAHRRVPAMNVVWSADAVRRFTTADIAVAVATDSGLLTPVIRDVDLKPPSVVSREIRELAEKARSGQLPQSALDGGTLTVTNLGMFGVEEFAAIINPPHAAILAVGAVRDEPVVVAGAVEAAKVIHLTLSVDHRPVDGVVAAQWMNAMVEMIENPLRILA